MSDCERTDDSAENDKEIAWLLACERGQPGPPVSDATAARYAQLKLLIAALPTMPADVAAHGGWQGRVLDAIAAKEAARGDPRHAASNAARTRVRRWSGPAGICAIVSVAVVLLLRPGGGSDGPVVFAASLTIEVDPGAGPVRGMDPSIGDKLIVRAALEHTGELRVYDEAGAEAARCGVPAPDCRVEHSGHRTTLMLTMPLRAPGVLSPILFAAPLGSPPAGMDSDVAAAARAGITMTTREAVRVR